MIKKTFRDTLNRIANGTITEADFKLLSTRFYLNNINSARHFEDAVCIMTKNKEIERYNYEKLESMKEPVVLINSINNCQEACSASADDAEGLLAQLRLCQGATVILRKNLGVSKCLANGAVGKVIDIVYDPSAEYENYYEIIPTCILVSFQKYTGLVLYENAVPIVPVVASLKKMDVHVRESSFLWF